MEMAGIAYHVMVCFVAALLNVPGDPSFEQADIQANSPVRREVARFSQEDEQSESLSPLRPRQAASLLLAGVFMMHLVCGGAAGSLARRRRRFHADTLLLNRRRLRQPGSLPGVVKP